MRKDIDIFTKRDSSSVLANFSIAHREYLSSSSWESGSASPFIGIQYLNFLLEEPSKK